jgi:N-acetylgalactosamine-N,N'-diacetylbacillosaminyl-diphospho-undecaprenol 4-alpha-N-acetylgalactosaminyltransferase
VEDEGLERLAGARTGGRPRILFVINSLTGGGAERVFSTVLRNSPAELAGIDAHVALLDLDPPAFSLPDGVTQHQLDCRHQLGRSIWSVAQTARRLQPDLIVSFLTRANVAAALAGRVAGCPVIISERNDTTAQLGHGRFPALARSIVRLGYRQADEVIAVSAGVGEAMRLEYGIAPNRVRVINNPVDLHAIAAAAAAEPALEVSADDVVMLARLEPQKNLPVAIEAFASSGWPGRLLILGEGPLRAELRGLGDRLGLGSRLVMPGYVANPHAVLARGALFMLASRHEGFCNSLVEAMAANVAVLASDCRFSPAEILEVETPPRTGEVVAGNGGLLVPVDDVAAMASGLRMLEDPALRARLAAAGRQRVQDFAVARQVARYWDAFREVADRNRGAHAASGRLGSQLGSVP